VTNEPQTLESTEDGPNPPPWALAPGNFVHVYWVNYRGRETETQGIVREFSGDCVLVTATSSTPLEKGVWISTSRIRHTDVILEGESGKDARKRAWELIKRSAGHINRRSTWEPELFFAAMQELAEIFPDIKKEKPDE
jgi:hypothetical protein